MKKMIFENFTLNHVHDPLSSRDILIKLMCKIINSLNILDLKNIKSIQQKLQMPNRIKIEMGKGAKSVLHNYYRVDKKL